MSINRDQNVVEYLCGKIGSILREDSFDYVEHNEEMSNAVLQTLMVGRGRELYVELQAMIGEQLQKMHQQVFISSFTDENKSVDEIDDRILQSLCRQWFEFSEKMIIVRQVLLPSESVFDNSVGEESLIVFAWRIYRSILEQDSELLPKLLVGNWRTLSDDIVVCLAEYRSSPDSESEEGQSERPPSLDVLRRHTL
uniref:Cullin domain-containing protein n=1 Tax=Globodera pallida TaxID=36090 RepID=A0A183BTC0_GLOPA